ncbi:MAG: Hg(II)-responsive transcriptional regulator [Rheinheimera sp.]|uniref:Hg(II)-responsive transcriptional regulator n=1 Tax=unclassified Arsukibacterium TaxID=2635278 RepID=UPI000C6074F5|nr:MULTISPECIES: Hg(II)-responsive transcriptional regulator [unclassified Arsukibacterium]MAC99288.1 Hg(II)-responsive transcriptional regulator [Pseudomonadales bacterium]MBM34843.1 Hg(II)-responsive transcriptional regulator [Rheinheimera sp.]HAW93652.1 Hg(II)-responsive transcriptional regulator [Candidatus Azambacteria bacterium]|tara:strand:- start:7149 stop:7550 length:402 start_codon:yes stop_codon:yes gene_type:complete
MYTISQLANSASVNVETVRYYERRGLIEQPDKPTGGYRRYPVTTLNRIIFIKRAQELGFTLEEISNLLTLNDAPCREVQDLASQKLTGVRAKMADLRRLELVLNNLINQCTTNPNQAHCPIIDSLLPEDGRRF